MPPMNSAGTVTNVKNKADISVTVNGSPDQGFQFVPATGQISAKYKFNPGTSTVTVKVSNACGNDSKTLAATLAEPCLPPKVNISLTPVDRTDATHELSGTVTNVKNKADISVTVNGSPDQGFQFVPATGQISAKYKFNPGTSTVTVKVSNACGNDSKTLAATQAEPCLPPKVNIALTPVDRTDATHELTGTVTNVKNKTDISVTVNGSPDQGFQFVPATGQISAKYKFNPGTSTVTVKVSNACGNDSKTLAATQAEPCLPPKVNISLTPVDRTDATHELSGTVTNVKNKTDISVTVNGSPDQGFQFVPATGQISAKYKFNPGTSTVTVKVSNACGNDSKTLAATQAEPCLPPKVNISLTPVDRTDATHELSGTVTNVKNKADISVTVNGSPDQGFQFVPATGQISAKYKFNPGTSTVTVKVSNACGNDSKTLAATQAEPCLPPKVNIALTPVDRTDATHELSGTVTNVKNKADISVTVNGSPDQGFQFVPATGQISAKYKFNPGTSTVTVKVSNACGSDSKTLAATQAEPCLPPKVNIALTPVDRTDATHELSGTVTNVKNKADISVTVNGSPDQGFQFVPATGQISAKYKFNPGTSTVTVKVSNACGSDSKTLTANREEEKACGTRINPGNSPWQFCLVTPGATFNRENLKNTGFSYSGPANSLFIQPTGGGGTATVNGKSYPLKPGQYYLFTGNLKVTVTSRNPGSLGQWWVCAESNREPATGNGNNRPKSPCE